MKKNTIADYEKAIKKKYAAIKSSGDADALLLEPTPAGLKRMCLMLLPDLNAIDLESYKRFFFLKEGVDFYKQIDNFDTSKFKALCKFLNGDSESTAPERVELLAILVGLEQRPYKKFSAFTSSSQTIILNEQQQVFYEKEEEEEERNLSSEENTDNHNGNETIKNSTLNLDPESKDTEITIVPQKLLIIPNSNRNIWTNRIKFILFFFLITVIGTYLAKGDLFKEKGCMMWMKDHYEEVDCNTKAVQSFYSAPIIALDRETLKYLKKVTVSDTTTFFNPDETPRIWYGKSANKELEYFTYFGQHPETGKELRRISHHMINNHIKNTK